LIVTGILEVKFSEDLDNAIVTSQSESHLRDLASAYSFFPEGQSSGAPLYTIATMYQGYQGDTDVDWLGRQQRTQDLKALANTLNVNLAHLHLVSDNGSFFLKGRIINTPRETGGRNATRIPFYVDCTPEK
jgi:hypothetical protein